MYLNFCFTSTAMLTMTFALSVLTNRQCVMLGALVMSLGYVLTAFAPTVQFLVFSYGVVCGKGHQLYHRHRYHHHHHHHHHHHRRRRPTHRSVTCH
jgi:hypothetical protein